MTADGGIGGGPLAGTGAPERPVAVLVSLGRETSETLLPRLLPLMDRRIAETGRGEPGATPDGRGGLRIDVWTPAGCTSYVRRGAALDPVAPEPRQGPYDFAFVIHGSPDAGRDGSRLLRCRRMARRTYCVDHALRYAAYPCHVEAWVGHQAMRLLRRCARRVQHRLARSLAAAHPALPVEAIAANARKLEAVRAIPPEALDARLGEGFRAYFGYGRGRPDTAPPDFSHQAVHVAAVRTILGSLDGKRILDLGSGFGIHALMLRGEGNYVVGLDRVETRARSLGRHGHTNLVGTVGTAERLPFARESFDVIFAHDAIQHVCDIAATFRACRFVLKRGGALIVSEVHPFHPDQYVCYGPFAPMRLGCRQLYVDQRAEHLRRRTGLPAGRAARLARRAESLTGAELDRWAAAGLGPEAIRALRRAQRARGEFTPWRAVNGWCEERYLRPAQIVSRLVRAGFGGARIQTVCLGHDGAGRPHLVRAGPFLDVLFSRYLVVARR